MGEERLGKVRDVGHGFEGAHLCLPVWGANKDASYRVSRPSAPVRRAGRAGAWRGIQASVLPQTPEVLPLPASEEPAVPVGDVCERECGRQAGRCCLAAWEGASPFLAHCLPAPHRVFPEAVS